MNTDKPQTHNALAIGKDTKPDFTNDTGVKWWRMPCDTVKALNFNAPERCI